MRLRSFWKLAKESRCTHSCPSLKKHRELVVVKTGGLKRVAGQATASLLVGKDHGIAEPEGAVLRKCVGDRLGAGCYFRIKSAHCQGALGAGAFKVAKLGFFKADIFKPDGIGWAGVG